MTANYHTHTTRCKHAAGTERQYIERAIEAGLKILGFSDHVPQPYPAGFTSGIRMDMAQLPEYIDTLMELREEYRDKIQILIGFEVEYTRKYFEPLLEALKKYPVDYLIQGQHFVPDEVSGFYAGSPTRDEERLKEYVDCTIEGMRTGIFSYLAHPDLIHFTGSDEVYCRHMSRIVEASLELKLPLEVNVYGFSDHRHYPCDRFFSMASQMGADFVVGCDSHFPEAVVQPKEVPGFMEFLQRNHIAVGDNTVNIIKPF